MSFPSSGFARLAGRKAATARWAKYPPGSPERAAQAAAMLAGRMRKYRERAAVIAAAQGLTLTPDQVERAAKALFDADMAERRMMGWKVRRARKAAGR